MEQNLTEIVEVPLEERGESEGPGAMFSGVHGESSPEGLAESERRGEIFRKRFDYRMCVPCDRCNSSLELRGFRRDGTEYVKSLLCMTGRIETGKWNTCNYGCKSKTGVKKVIYDKENMPLGFELGMAKSNVVEVEKKERAKRPEPTIPADGYRGGSKYYKRSDGRAKVEGEREMPKGLIS